ncbi:MAG: 30S ribosomal protein S21 [Phycisphaerales bacterium]|jgi:small subunit ribosomal protein S21|nr:30S ribosomal protein S21 [Phycisphaerales bacterium]
MAIRIKARQNESASQMLRRFKKLCEKENLIKDVKKRQYFEKPSERKRREKKRTISRIQRELNPEFQRTPPKSTRSGGGRGR